MKLIAFHLKFISVNITAIVWKKTTSLKLLMDKIIVTEIFVIFFSHIIYYMM